jgi:hypothetical protein
MFKTSASSLKQYILSNSVFIYKKIVQAALRNDMLCQLMFSQWHYRHMHQIVWITNVLLCNLVFFCFRHFRFIIVYGRSRSPLLRVEQSMILSLAAAHPVFTTQVSISMLGKDTLNYKYVWGQEYWEMFTVLITNLEAGTYNCSRERNTSNCIYWRHKFSTNFWNHPVVWTLGSVARFQPLNFVGLDTWRVTRFNLFCSNINLQAKWGCRRQPPDIMSNCEHAVVTRLNGGTSHISKYGEKLRTQVGSKRESLQWNSLLSWNLKGSRPHLGLVDSIQHHL